VRRGRVPDVHHRVSTGPCGGGIPQRIIMSFVPGAFMTVGMEPKRAAWLERVLSRLVNG